MQLKIAVTRRVGGSAAAMPRMQRVFVAITATFIDKKNEGWTMPARSRKTRLRGSGLGNVWLAALILAATVGEAPANTKCDEVGKLLSEVAETTHKIHVAGNAGQTSKAKRLSALALKSLNGSYLSSVADEHQDRRLRSTHSSFVRLLEEVRSVSHGQNRTSIQQLVNARLSPALPELIAAFSKTTLCNFQHLQSQLEHLQQARRAGTSPMVGGQPGGSKISNLKSAGGNDSSGIGEFFADPLKSGLFFSLALLSAAALYLVDRRETRRKPRFDLKFDTQIVYAGVPVNGHVCNIGHGGAKFRPNPGVAIDDDLVISIDGKDVVGNIRWHNETSVGIAFADHFDDEDLEKLKCSLG